MSLQTIQRNIDSGLVLHIPFTEGVGTKVFDRSPEDNHGDITLGLGGEAAFWLNTRDELPVGTFDGLADYVTVPDKTSLDATVFTISAWFRTTDVTKQSPLISKGSTSSNQPQFFLSLSSSTLRFAARGNIGGGNTDLVNNDDNHCVLVFDEVNDYAQLYLNGVLDGEFDAPLNVINSDNEAATIGRRYFGGTIVYADGMIDDVRMYDRILSDQEIRYLANMRRRI